MQTVFALMLTVITFAFMFVMFSQVWKYPMLQSGYYSALVAIGTLMVLGFSSIV